MFKLPLSGGQLRSGVRGTPHILGKPAPSMLRRDGFVSAFGGEEEANDLMT